MQNDDVAPRFLQRTTEYDWNSTIMVAAIISLSFVAVLVTILYIYARCILRRQARRQAALRHLTTTTTEPPRSGLDPSVIASLPSFVTKQASTRDGNETGSMECSVCLSILEDGEMGRTLPNCKHTFHAECVDKWFVSKSTCPVCRAEAEPLEGVEVVVVEAPPSDQLVEGAASDGGGNAKGSGSTSRLSSFKRILSRERSSKRMQMQNQSCAQEDGLSDVERQ